MRAVCTDFGCELAKFNGESGHVLGLKVGALADIKVAP